MSQEGWDDYFFKHAKVAASKSKDRSTKVGAVVVGSDHDIRATGYNGFPRGVNDDVDERHERPQKYEWAEHAERNAIYHAALVGVPLKGCAIYIDWFPCTDCARAIIQSGITEVVVDGRGYQEKKAYWYPRWQESCDRAKEMLREAGVTIRIPWLEGEE